MHTDQPTCPHCGEDLSLMTTAEIENLTSIDGVDHEKLPTTPADVVVGLGLPNNVGALESITSIGTLPTHATDIAAEADFQAELATALREEGPPTQLRSVTAVPPAEPESIGNVLGVLFSSILFAAIVVLIAQYLRQRLTDWYIAPRK